MKTIKGNLIKLAEEGEFDVIIHGCNCFNSLGAGLARQLAVKYPQVLKADKQTEYGDREKLGTYTSAIVEIDNRYFAVVNSYTQYKWSSGSDVFEYAAFQRFLNNFIIPYSSEKPSPKWKIGFPMIGAGLAGGDWSRISKMIENFSERLTEFADVTIVEYQP